MNTLDFINKNKNLKYDEIRKMLFNNHVVKSVETNSIHKNASGVGSNDNSKYRIILSKSRKIDNSSPIHQECNGLILEHDLSTNEYKIVCLPIKSSNVTNYNHVSINIKKKMCNYNVFKIYDGTIINLYYYNNKWCFSSHKGFDVTNKIFYIYTYKHIFDMIVEEKYPTFSYDMLDKNKSYTFCLKYEKYHIFNSFDDNNSIIYLQSCNIKELNENNKLVLERDELPFPIEEQEYRIQNIEQIIDLCKTEYSMYNKSKNSYYRNYEYTPTFGFLLKKKKGDGENIIIHTSLYVNIKNTIYNNAFKINETTKLPDNIINSIDFDTINKYSNIDTSLIDLDKKMQINNHLVILNLITKYMANLKKNKTNILTTLYSQLEYQELFSYLKIFVYNSLSTIMYNNINILKNVKNNNINIEDVVLKFNNAPYVSNQIIVSKITQLMVFMYDNCSDLFDFTNKDEVVFNYKSLLQDFIVSEKYAILYYELFCLFKCNDIKYF